MSTRAIEVLRPLALLLAALALAAGCGETGGQRFTFAASAAGPEGGTGGPLAFPTGLGFNVTLTRARVHVGAVYLNESVPTSGAQGGSCILPGLYAAQVLSGLDVDVLRGEAQPFPERGEAITLPAALGEVWLTGVPIDVVDDSTVILDVAGEAEKEGTRWPFEGRITISRNRLVPPATPVLPGANPICKQRIVATVFDPAAPIVPTPGGSLRLRANPRAWFDGVDFRTLAKASEAPLLYRFADAAVAPADIALYGGLRSRAAWTYSWNP